METNFFRMAVGDNQAGVHVGLLIFIFAALCSGRLTAQGIPPPIEWQGSFGGTEEESLYSIALTADGGYLLGGNSSSPPGGNKTAPDFSGADYWIVRLDAQGNQLWDRSFGGVGFDHAFAVGTTIDGGYVVGGGSTSGVGGNKTTPHYGTATHDYWVLRLDSNGNKLWEQNYGGTYMDISKGAQQVADFGFVIAGFSGSPPSGNKISTNFGNTDFWMLRLDSNGLKLWEKSFGGSYGDDLWTFNKAGDGFILGGASWSQASGNKSSTNYGSSDFYHATPDFWVVRVDGDGNKVWDQSFGGTNSDTLYAIGELPEGGFMLGGRSDSPPGGNKTSTHFGGYDYWVVRTDAAGNKLWERSFGGDRNEQMYSLDVTSDGGVILGGWSSSAVSGNKTATNFGGTDFWVVRLDADGNKLWDAAFGGSRTDEIQSIKQTRDGGFILGGWSYSPADGNKTTPNYPPFNDYLVKLAPERPYLRLTGSPPFHNGCPLLLEGIKNLTYVIECSANLNVWTPLQTNRMTSSAWPIVDGSTTNAVQRFYRARVL